MKLNFMKGGSNLWNVTTQLKLSLTYRRIHAVCFWHGLKLSFLYYNTANKEYFYQQ